MLTLAKGRKKRAPKHIYRPGYEGRREEVADEAGEAVTQCTLDGQN